MGGLIIYLTKETKFYPKRHVSITRTRRWTECSVRMCQTIVLMFKCVFLFKRAQKTFIKYDISMAD
jgi:hypothetical protein